MISCMGNLREELIWRLCACACAYVCACACMHACMHVCVCVCVCVWCVIGFFYNPPLFLGPRWYSGFICLGHFITAKVWTESCKDVYLLAVWQFWVIVVTLNYTSCKFSNGKEMVMTNSQICKDLLFINLNKCNVLVQRNSQRTTAIRASMKIYTVLNWNQARRL